MNVPERDGGRARAWILLAILGAGLAATLFGRHAPAPLALEAEPQRFSAGRAHALVAEIARAPHPVGSSEHERVRAVLLERIDALGFEVAEQAGEVDRLALTNLILRVPGTAPTGTLLCLAHYDSVPTGPGAGDDSVGVASWLEAFRTLRERGWRPRNDVLLVLTDGEERGLLGARLFAEHPLAQAVACVVNLEAIGNGGPAVLFQLGRENGACVRAFAAAVAAPTGTSLGDAVYRRMPNDTDLTVFLQRGVPGFNLALTAGSPAYHAPHDTPANLDPESLQHMGECALALAEHLGAADLTALRAPDETFFDLLGYVLVHHSKAWDGLIALLAGALALLACARARVRGRELLELGLRHACEVALVSGCAGLVFWLCDSGVAWFTPAPSWVLGNTTSGALLFAGATLLAAGGELVLAGTHTGSRPARPGTLALLWSGAAMAALRWLPGAGFVFAWPAILAALGMLATIERPRSRLGDALLALGFAGALVLGLPILYLLLQLFQRAPLPAVLVTSALLASGTALFGLVFQDIRRALSWSRTALLTAGALALLASVLVARVLAWRQGALWP